MGNSLNRSRATQTADSNAYVQWKTAKLNRLLHEFHKKQALVPTKRLDSLTDSLEPLFDEFVDVLALRGIRCRWVYAGSFAEDVLIAHPKNNTIELDVEFVIKHSHLQVSYVGDDASSQHVQIDPPNEQSKYKLPHFFLDEERHVSAICVLDAFDTAFRDVIDSWEAVFKRQGSVVHKKQGPAARVTINHKNRERIFVDLVPLLDVPGVGRFVAKQRPCGERKDYFWRQSFSQREKDQYPSPNDKPYAKACLRILKAFTLKNEVMKHLTSYHWKNLLLQEIENNPRNRWRKEDVARRVLGLLAALRAALRNGDIPQFFDNEVNLLRPVSESARKDMQRFINRLLSNKVDFKKAFTA